jgi:DNA polymerase-3 subunit beta
MEIKAKRGELLATLYWTQSIVERRNTMPILANVLIEAKKGGIHVTATDLEVGVRGQVDGEVAKEGTVTLNAKKLYEIVREVSHDQVQLKRLENEWVEIRSGKSVFKIVGMDAREFPQFPAFDAKGLSTTPASTIREMIERTIFAVSTDETRYSLNGVFTKMRVFFAETPRELAMRGILEPERGVVFYFYSPPRNLRFVAKLERNLLFSCGVAQGRDPKL